MIKNPGPFLAAGARLPSGLLMVGPPGTGKTLMARVMASEAGVPVSELFFAFFPWFVCSLLCVVFRSETALGKWQKFN